MVRLGSRRTDAMEYSVDFAIVTALKVERDAVLKRVKNQRRVEQPDDPYVYFSGEMEIAGNTEPYRIVVAAFLEPGNVASGIETAELLRRWHPRFVLMVGISGGFTTKGVNRGDVLVADYVHYYEPGKQKAEGEERRFRHYRCDRILWAKARNYEAAEWKGEIDVPRPSGFESNIPRALFGPIGCGEKVVADTVVIAELLKECPQMLGVAMEAAGVAMAVENAGISFLEIRGVSDAADLTKDDAWHAYAVNAAAAFTAGFLRSKPVSTAAEIASREAALGRLHARPLALLRAQSLRAIRPDELLDALPPELRNREHEMVALDFTDLVGLDRGITDPERAARRLVNPEGALLAALHRRDELEFVFHGLVHIPFAALAGFLVSDRQAVRFYDFHPNTYAGTWCWPGMTSPHPKIVMTGLPTNAVREKGDVIVRMSVNYPAGAVQSRSAVPTAVLEVELGLEQPERGIVRTEEQVREYAAAFREVLDRLAAKMPGCGRVHLFYAGPVSLAFHLGQQISENIHPPVVVWNYRREDGYNWAVDLLRACRGEPSILEQVSRHELS